MWKTESMTYFMSYYRKVLKLIVNNIRETIRRKCIFIYITWRRHRSAPKTYFTIVIRSGLSMQRQSRGLRPVTVTDSSIMDLPPFINYMHDAFRCWDRIVISNNLGDFRLAITIVRIVNIRIAAERYIYRPANTEYRTIPATREALEIGRYI